ncbi:hypothetical protein V6N12_029790 [Hibiscus sabdariffa]|uniref:Uncharacterized protein n=1 Tax=Hibiscus sabdariffa TaxID=183260 RepID=A0ABR2CYU3_9ROSI
MAEQLRAPHRALPLETTPSKGPKQRGQKGKPLEEADPNKTKEKTSNRNKEMNRGFRGDELTSHFLQVDGNELPFKPS